MAGCAALHVVAAAGSAGRSGVQVLVLLGMGLACIPCATHALLAPSRRTWVQGGVVAGAMLVVHPLLSGVDAGHAGHAGGPVPAMVGIGMLVAPAAALCLACAGAAACRRGAGERRADS